MGRKIICSECNTIFDEDVLKAKSSENTCLVCGSDLGGSNTVGKALDADNVCETFYFDSIFRFSDESEYNSVNAYCIKCGTNNSLSLDKFDELVDKEYALLKEGITVKCRGCGKEHTDRKILYKRKAHYATANIPKCPICQSTNLKKITMGSKLFAAGTIGVFALPHTSKTYECKSCGYKF